MHTYRRHIGDYAKKAGRLSLLQHGVYGQLMDACYDREDFPTRDEAVDWVWASTSEEIEAVDFILRKFFTLGGDGRWVQKRVQEELFEYWKFCEQQGRKGKKGGRPKKTDGLNEKPDGLSEKPDGNPMETQWGQEKTLTDNRLPSTDNLEPIKPKTPTSLRDHVPVTAIVDLYHEKLPALPRCQKLTKARISQIRQRWREDLPALKNWGNYFDYIALSDFLMGRAEATNGRVVFQANLEWITKAANYTKILEGKYHGV